MIEVFPQRRRQKKNFTHNKKGEVQKGTGTVGIATAASLKISK
jgi:hypothetical protein